MTVTGPVHGNQWIYADPGATLAFEGDVTSARDIINEQKPGDPNTSRNGTIDWGGNRHVGGQSSLNMPIGLDNSPANVHKIVEPPPIGEDPFSPLGKQRFYNKADMIITVNADGTTTVTSGIVNNKSTVVNLASLPNSMKFLDVTRQLYNKRESKTVKQVEIDVARLAVWNSSLSNTFPARPVTGGTKDVTIVYVDDKRSVTSSEETGVLVKNGSLLPSIHGLTIATPEPIYVAGDYNIKDASGTSSGSSTTHTRPAALIGDAITILSKAWDVTESELRQQSLCEPRGAIDHRECCVSRRHRRNNDRAVQRGRGKLSALPRKLERQNVHLQRLDGRHVSEPICDRLVARHRQHDRHLRSTDARLGFRSEFSRREQTPARNALRSGRHPRRMGVDPSQHDNHRRSQRVAPMRYLASMVLAGTLMAPLFAAAQSFTVLWRTEHPPEMDVLRYLEIQFAGNTFTVVPQWGYTVHTDLSAATIRFSAPTGSVSMTLQFSTNNPNALLASKENLRRHLSPDESIVTLREEFPACAGASLGKGMELDFVSSNRSMRRRAALIPIANGYACFTATSKVEESKTAQLIMGGMLTSFQRTEPIPANK